MTTYPDDIGDSRLVQLTAEGDALAFTALYDRYSGSVYAVALKILADCAEASDVQQQVFLKFHTKFSSRFLPYSSCVMPSTPGAA